MKLIPIILAVVLFAGLAHADPVDLHASWYSRADLIRDGQDKRTHFMMANGKEFHDADMVCASWDFPLGTLVRVTHITGGNSIIVRVSDRTARRFKGKRIDLSKGAMEALGGKRALIRGLLPVSVEVVI